MSEKQLTIPKIYHDLPLEVSVIVGKRKIKIKELANIQIGSVLELNKYTGSCCDITINNTKIAEGEIIAINENLGVRITSII